MKTLRHYGPVALVGVLVLALALSCTEKNSPLTDSETDALPITVEALSFDELFRNDYGDPSSRQIYIAYAGDVTLTTPQQPMPVLYLLHDWLGGANYFEIMYNLQALVQDMYQKGEIGRMMIVTVDASNGLGGSFYRNAGSMGDYEDLLGKTIHHIETQARAYIAGGAQARAISGHGMGGYGAFRYAMENPDMFGAVSSMSGPLSFGEVDSDFGVWGDLVPKVFEENGITVPDLSKQLFGRLAQGRHIYDNTSLFMAMSAGFGPHPLRQLDSVGTLIRCGVLCNCVCKDTFYNVPFFSALPAGRWTMRIRDIGDTLGVGVDMIFDSTGQRDDENWSYWQNNADVKRVFAAKRMAAAAFFDDVEMYFDCGMDDELGYLAQNNDFDRFLREEAGITHHTYDRYEGYGSTPAGHWELIQSRLKMIIKWHDKLFVRPVAPR